MNSTASALPVKSERLLHIANDEYENNDISIFQMTDRDTEILLAVNRFRFLHTFQIARLVESSVASIRRRLKLLYQGRFLNRYAQFVKQGDPKPPVAYYLGEMGAQFLRERNEQVFVYPKSGKVKHLFFNHALDLSEFRGHLELASRHHEKVELAHFVSYFEQEQSETKRVGYARYKLFFEFEDHEHKKTVVYPDALFVLQLQKQPHIKALYFVEIDRSTESLSVIRRKLRAYNAFYQQMQHRRFGNFGVNADGSDRGFKLLIQCKSKKRMLSLQKALGKTYGIGALKRNDMIRMACVHDIDRSTIVDGDVWMNADGKCGGLVR